MNTSTNEGYARRKFIAVGAALLAAGMFGVPSHARAAGAPAGQVPARDAALKPGQFVWQPELAPNGPLVVLVSLDEQRAYVYRDGTLIGVSTVSSGRDGYETPTGVFTILQKSRDHKSNIYDDAPMPFMQRLTWDGIALHGGAIPGHPASHGCVRLPKAFAEKIYAATKRGDTVVVSDARVHPAGIAYPAMLAPVGSAEAPPLADGPPDAFWDESVKPDGPLSVLVSLPEQRVFVLSNGVVMGSAALQTDAGLAFDGAVLMVMSSTQEDRPSTLDPSQNRYRWASYPVVGQPPPMQDLEAHIKAPPDFMRRLYGVLKPGTTLLVTSIRPLHRKALARGAAPTERVLESLP
ncbi:L,D-transpeptidase [Comamonadaceae bacterium PP-2]